MEPPQPSRVMGATLPAPGIRHAGVEWEDTRIDKACVCKVLLPVDPGPPLPNFLDSPLPQIALSAKATGRLLNIVM